MIWYPYEQMKTMKDPYKILDAEGVHLYTKDQKLIDSISVSYTHLLLYVKLCVSLWQLNLRKQSWLIFFQAEDGIRDRVM